MHSMTNSVSIHPKSLWNKFNYPHEAKSLQGLQETLLLNTLRDRVAVNITFEGDTSWNKEVPPLKALVSEAKTPNIGAFFQSYYKEVPHTHTHLLDLDPIASELVVPGCVSINVINSVNQLNLKWGNSEKKNVFIIAQNDYRFQISQGNVELKCGHKNDNLKSWWMILSTLMTLQI